MNNDLGTFSLIASPLPGLGERFWLDFPTLKRGAGNLRASGATKAEPDRTFDTKSEPDPAIGSFHAIALSTYPEMRIFSYTKSQALQDPRKTH